LLLIGCVNEFTWNAKNLYLGYLIPYTFHNPTVVLLKPFTIPLFAFALMIFNSVRVRLPIIIVCAVLSALSILAKPNYGLALVPALILVSGYAMWKKWSLNGYLLAAIVLPIVATLGWQYFYYGAASGGGFEFAPLKVMSYFSPDGLFLKFL